MNTHSIGGDDVSLARVEKVQQFLNVASASCPQVTGTVISLSHHHSSFIISAVRIFEIYNRIEQLLQYSIRLRYAVAEWYRAGLCDREVAGSTPALAAVYQRQLSVPSLRGRLMSTSESWGSKRAYHAMH